MKRWHSGRSELLSSSLFNLVETETQLLDFFIFLNDAGLVFVFGALQDLIGFNQDISLG